MRIYIAVTSPYRLDRGVTGWYQSLGSHILSMSRWQIKGKKFVIGMHESWLYNPTTSAWLSFSFLIILPLIPNPFHLFTVLIFHSLYTNLRYG